MLVTLAALALVRARRRFTAVLLVGVVGYGVGGLFIVDGAPDLALAQFLVETLSLVAFVFVLRRLPAQFTERAAAAAGRRCPRPLHRGGRGRDGRRDRGRASAAPARCRRRPAPSSSGSPREGAGATNVISAIIVDFRALDTVGEIGVLFVAAAGVASLVLATRYDRRRRRGEESGAGSPEHEEEVIGDVGGGEPPEEPAEAAPVPSEHEEVRP